MLDPARLVFIDETATSTNMVRLRGRCPRGERLIASVPHGHWKTITFVAGLRHRRARAARIVDIPPATETRMIKDEVVVQIASNMTADQLQAAVRRLGLTVIASESLTNSGSTVVRLKITDGKTPAPPSDRSRMSAWPQSCSRTTSTTWTRQPPTRRPRRRGTPASRATRRNTSSRSSRCWMSIA